MKSPKQFKRVTSMGISIVIVFKICLAIITYIAYVDTIDDIIIDELPGSTLRGALGLMYCAALVGSMPIQLNPISDTIFRTKFLDDKIKLFRDNPTTKYYTGAIVSILFCAGIALVIPNLHTMFNIAGSLMGIMTMTIFPVLFYNKAFADEITTTRWTLHWLMIVVITACGLTSIVYTIAGNGSE